MDGSVDKVQLPRPSTRVTMRQVLHHFPEFLERLTLQCPQCNLLIMHTSKVPFPPYLTFFTILLVFSGIPSRVNYLHSNPCRVYSNQKRVFPSFQYPGDPNPLCLPVQIVTVLESHCPAEASEISLCSEIKILFSTQLAVSQTQCTLSIVQWARVGKLGIRHAYLS